MNDWKVRQHVYHQLFNDIGFGDDLKNETIEYNSDTKTIIEKALEYPKVQSEVLFYPGKSYSIAVIYALLLNKYFEEDVYQSLNDPELLYGNDPHFVTYDKDPSTYDSILNDFPVHFIADPSLGCDNFQLTHEYFHKEFLLHDETKIYAPVK